MVYILPAGWCLGWSDSAVPKEEQLFPLSALVLELKRTWVTFLLRYALCMTDHCCSVLLHPHVPAPRPSSDDISAKKGWMWQTDFFLHLCPILPAPPKGGWAEWRDGLERKGRLVGEGIQEKTWETEMWRVPEDQQHQTNLSSKSHYSDIQCVFHCTTKASPSLPHTVLLPELFPLIPPPLPYCWMVPASPCPVGEGWGVRGGLSNLMPNWWVCGSS